MNSTILVGIGLKSCIICNLLKDYMTFYVSTISDTMNFDWKWIELQSEADKRRLPFAVRGFPTILAYKNGKLRLGWEGFAALAPEEIKREMVEDVLRQVAALADEPDEIEVVEPLPSASPPPSPVRGR